MEGKGYPIGLLLSRVTICFNPSVGGYSRQVRRFNEWRKHASAAQLVTAYEPAVRLHLVRLACFRQTRNRVAAILTRLGYTPVIQEIFGTEPGDLRQVLRDKIDACEGLIQIIGQSYGAEPPTVDPDYGRVSYTQFEFLYARSQKKKPWLLLAGDACTRDTPLECLDLPSDPAHPDPAGYQAERRALQLAYCDKRKKDGHLYHTATSDADLDLKVERLRDELAELRRRCVVVFSLARESADQPGRRA